MVILARNGLRNAREIVMKMSKALGRKDVYFEIGLVQTFLFLGNC